MLERGDQTKFIIRHSRQNLIQIDSTEDSDKIDFFDSDPEVKPRGDSDYRHGTNPIQQVDQQRSLDNSIIQLNRLES